MAQNVYDTPAFFKEYTQLPRSLHGLAGAPEWSTLRKLVGDIQGTRVLDLGCGFGWFCRWAKKDARARSVHGVDISENMLARAKEMTSEADYSEITYQRADLEGLVLKQDSYDFVYSCLVFHYLPTDSLKGLIAQIYGCLSPGGRFVFMIEHPVATAPFDPSWKWDPEGRVYWPLNQYWDEGLRVTDWLAKGVRKHHRTVETYLSLVMDSGFVLTAFKESWEGLELKTKWDERGEAHRPYFLLIAAQKHK
jgi:SAM-dependent methyltransferase